MLSMFLIATEHGAPFICWLISAILLVIALVTCRSWWGPNPSVNTPGFHSPLVVAGLLFFVLGFLFPLL